MDSFIEETSFFETQQSNRQLVSVRKATNSMDFEAFSGTSSA